jgi:hypothetical protein
MIALLLRCYLFAIDFVRFFLQLHLLKTPHQTYAPITLPTSTARHSGACHLYFSTIVWIYWNKYVRSYADAVFRVETDELLLTEAVCRQITQWDKSGEFAAKVVDDVTPTAVADTSKASGNGGGDAHIRGGIRIGRRDKPVDSSTSTSTSTSTSSSGGSILSSSLHTTADIAGSNTCIEQRVKKLGKS